MIYARLIMSSVFYRERLGAVPETVLMPPETVLMPAGTLVTVTEHGGGWWRVVPYESAGPLSALFGPGCIIKPPWTPLTPLEVLVMATEGRIEMPEEAPPLARLTDY